MWPSFGYSRLAPEEGQAAFHSILPQRIHFAAFEFMKLRATNTTLTSYGNPRPDFERRFKVGRSLARFTVSSATTPVWPRGTRTFRAPPHLEE